MGSVKLLKMQCHKELRRASGSGAARGSCSAPAAEIGSNKSVVRPDEPQRCQSWGQPGWGGLMLLPRFPFLLIPPEVGLGGWGLPVPPRKVCVFRWAPSTP